MADRFRKVPAAEARYPCILCDDRLALVDSVFCQPCIDGINGEPDDIEDNAFGRRDWGDDERP